MATEELLPCPQGHKTVLPAEWPTSADHRAPWRWYIKCTCCGWRGPSSATEAEAITAWNQRPDRGVGVGELVEELEALPFDIAAIRQEGFYPVPSDLFSRILTALRAPDHGWRECEPVAVRYNFDGYGFQYIDSGSGSDWLTRHPDGEALYPLPPKDQARG